jgi:hypothetical protein
MIARGSRKSAGGAFRRNRIRDLRSGTGSGGERMRCSTAPGRPQGPPTTRSASALHLPRGTGGAGHAEARLWEPAECSVPCSAEERRGRDRSAVANRRGGALPDRQDAHRGARRLLDPGRPGGLRTLECVHRRESLVVCGPSGPPQTLTTYKPMLLNRLIAANMPNPASAAAHRRKFSLVEPFPLIQWISDQLTVAICGRPAVGRRSAVTW